MRFLRNADASSMHDHHLLIHALLISSACRATASPSLRRNISLSCATFVEDKYELNGTGMLCIGAALDFIAGTQKRAPSITQKIGLEWAWRMLLNPRRSGPRYARCAAAVPRLVARTIPQIVTARIRKAA